MPRPFCRRRIGWRPGISRFFPEGGKFNPAEIITLKLDELEAIRLADLDGLYQEEAAEKMGVSRPTFARILESARRKVAEALVKGKGLVIEGGPVEFSSIDSETTEVAGGGTGLNSSNKVDQSRRIREFGSGFGPSCGRGHHPAKISRGRCRKMETL
ncbi:MAG TPA: DUF134 domain-containing protein [Candidatus Aminicenantes bacterium]|nr:DUF134 domain-containing protein [Candidatus Aminicenantes bacterium]